jgi:hypothetical protein
MPRVIEHDMEAARLEHNCLAGWHNQLVDWTHAHCAIGIANRGMDLGVLGAVTLR